MSELKRFDIVGKYTDEDTMYEFRPDGECYDADEADKVIRHNKYKRCLAMAERCKYRMYYLSAVIDYESSKLVPNPTAVKRHMKKESRMDYWKNRWLEFAEQFKEDK